MARRSRPGRGGGVAGGSFRDMHRLRASRRPRLLSSGCVPPHSRLRWTQCGDSMFVRADQPDQPSPGAPRLLAGVRGGAGRRRPPVFCIVSPVLDVEWSIDVFRYGSYLAMAAIALGLATIVPTRPGDRRRGFVWRPCSAWRSAWRRRGLPISWFLRAQRSARDQRHHDRHRQSAGAGRHPAAAPRRAQSAGLSRRQRRRAAARRLSRHRAGHPGGAAGRGLQAGRQGGDGDGLGRRGARAGRRAHRGHRDQ